MIHTVNVHFCTEYVREYADHPCDNEKLECINNNAKFKHLKDTLNASKDKLNHIPNHKKKILLANLDRLSSLKSKIKGEGITNAWIKMFEIGTHFKFNYDATFCNAEFPGAFICAINHLHSNKLHNTKKTQKKQKKIQELNWAASSYVSGPLNDTLGVYQLNRNRWIMNNNMDGDTTNIHNIKKINELVFKTLGRRPTLYTADGSIDIHENFNQQEMLNAKLILGEIVCAFETLTKGGDCVIKVFTLFESFTISLITLFAASFEKVSIVKPTASRDANSEVYLVGINFISNHHVNQLLENALVQTDFSNSEIKPIIPLTEELMDEFFFIVKSITDRQTRVIEQVYDYHLNNTMPDVAEKQFAANLWLSMHKIYPLNFHIIQKPKAEQDKLNENKTNKTPNNANDTSQQCSSV